MDDDHHVEGHHTKAEESKKELKTKYMSLKKHASMGAVTLTLFEPDYRAKILEYCMDNAGKEEFIVYILWSRK
jgi:hypothetical protein